MKVLIILNKVQKYRVPIYNLLAEYVDLTVAHSENTHEDSSIAFKQIVINTRSFCGLTFHKRTLLDLANQFDVVIALSNLRSVDLMRLSLLNARKFKLIYWGIGVSASTQNNRKYDEDKKLDFLRRFFFKRADANIFYCDYPIEKYCKWGLAKKSLFVANNTVSVYYELDQSYVKNSLLFIGSLYKSKGIEYLLRFYYEAYKVNPNIPGLNIIGDGDQISFIQDFVRSRNLTNIVKVIGPVHDEVVLHEYFRSSFLTVSPNQAGLSVLSSFGHGVPFITSKHSITGGERLNIKSGYNGILYDDHSEMKSIFLDVADNPDKYVLMGDNARNFYVQNRLPEMMVDGIFRAIQYVCGAV